MSQTKCMCGTLFTDREWKKGEESKWCQACLQERSDLERMGNFATATLYQVVAMLNNAASLKEAITEVEKLAEMHEKGGVSLEQIAEMRKDAMGRK